jgi:hypothetical protein
MLRLFFTCVPYSMRDFPVVLAFGTMTTGPVVQDLVITRHRYGLHQRELDVVCHGPSPLLGIFSRAMQASLKRTSSDTLLRYLQLADVTVTRQSNFDNNFFRRIVNPRTLCWLVFQVGSAGLGPRGTGCVFYGHFTEFIKNCYSYSGQHSEPGPSLFPI